jgi:autotransporter translocation and assembly factor TamB
MRNNLVDPRLSADLLLGGTGRFPVLTGHISTDEGHVTFAETRIRIRSAFADLVRADPMNPHLQIVLGETLRGYDVTVTITGTLLDPEVALDSSPPLERERLLVLIATGQTVEGIEGGGVGRFAATEAAKLAGRRIIRYFSAGPSSEPTFLDRFSIETGSAPGPRYEDPVRVIYGISKDLLFLRDELFLQAERDAYGDYNGNVGFTFQVK